MSRYLLDTSTVIDYARSIEPVRSRLDALLDSRQEIGVTAIQLSEFWTGTEAVDRAAWEDFFEGIDFWEISAQDAIDAGVYRHDFSRAGIQLSITDVLTAAVARSREAVLITENVKLFPMTDIRVLSLRFQAANGHVHEP